MHAKDKPWKATDREPSTHADRDEFEEFLASQAPCLGRFKRLGCAYGCHMALAAFFLYEYRSRRRLSTRQPTPLLGTKTFL